MVDAVLAVTESDDTLSSSATVSDRAALLAVTEAADTCVAGCTALMPFTFQSMYVELGHYGQAIFDFSGVTLVDSGLVITESVDTAAGTANIGAPVDSTLDVTEAGDTLTSYVAHPRIAIAAIIEGSDTLDAAATSVNGPECVFSVVESADTLSSAALVDIKPAGSITEDADALYCGAEVPVSCVAYLVEGGDGITSAAQVIIGASSAAQEAYDTVVSQVSMFLSAQAAMVEAGDTLYGVVAPHIIGPPPDFFTFVLTADNRVGVVSQTMRSRVHMPSSEKHADEEQVIRSAMCVDVRQSAVENFLYADYVIPVPPNSRLFATRPATSLVTLEQ